MVAEYRLITADEFLAEYDPDVRAELIDGVVVVSPEPSMLHQWIGPKLIQASSAFLLRHKLGHWFNPINLRPSGYTVLNPDLALYPFGIRPTTKMVWTSNPPLIIVEILSSSNRNHDVITKRSRYAEIGVPEYWIIDPDRELISINLLNEGQLYDEVTFNENLVPAGLLKGLRIDMDWFFGKKDVPDDLPSER